MGPSSDDNCPDECVTEDHCPSNMICCANGCGGHVCSHSNEFCKVRLQNINDIITRV